MDVTCGTCKSPSHLSTDDPGQTWVCSAVLAGGKRKGELCGAVNVEETPEPDEE